MNSIETMSTKFVPNTSNGAAQDQLVADIKVVMADAQELLRVTASQGGEKIEELRIRARDSLNKLTARLEEVQASTLKYGKQAAAATDVYVQENPWKMIGVAGGLGVVIGALLARRRS